MTNMTPERVAFLAALDAFRKADPVGLWHDREALEGAIRGATFPALEVTPVPETEDNYGYTALRCPHCTAMLGAEGDPFETGADLVAVDTSERWTTWQGLDDKAVTDKVAPFAYDGSSDYSGIGYECGSCYNPVALPDGWTEATL